MRKNSIARVLPPYASLTFDDLGRLTRLSLDDAIFMASRYLATVRLAHGLPDVVDVQRVHLRPLNKLSSSNN